MLKTIELSDKPASNRNDSGKSASDKNNDSKSAFGKNNDNGEVNGFNIGKNGIEYTKKSGKLSKSGKSKSEKMSKS